MKIIKKYNEFVNENVETLPEVKPSIKPITPSRRKSPIRRTKPSVTPKPKATLDEVVNIYLDLIKDDNKIKEMLKNKYSK